MQTENKENSTIKVSFIIPMYKGKEFILDCVSNIKKVQYPKEILIIDDGSPDDSLLFCERVFQKDDEIMLYTKSNGGIASTRNFGLEKAKGQYVIFVDQDDVVIPNVVSKAIAKIESTKSEILFWNTDCLLDSGERQPNTYSLYEQIINRKDIINEVLPHFLYKKKTELKCELGPIWGAVFSRLFIQENKIQFRSFINYEDDHLFIFDSLLYAETICFLPEVGYCWRIRKESTSHRRKKTTNYIEKALKSDQYRFDRYQKVCNEPHILKEYTIYIKQKVIISGINNVCTFYNWSWSEIKQIRRLLYKDDYITAFRSAKLINRNNYTIMVYNLIRRRMDWIAYIFSYLNSIRLLFCRE